MNTPKKKYSAPNAMEISPESSAVLCSSSSYSSSSELGSLATEASAGVWVDLN